MPGRSACAASAASRSLTRASLAARPASVTDSHCHRRPFSYQHARHRSRAPRAGYTVIPPASEFAALRSFALGGTDHRTHAWQGEMIAAYMRPRNARAQPKRNFAPKSVIRTWSAGQVNVA